MNDILDFFGGFFNRFIGLVITALTIYLFVVTGEIRPGEALIVIMLFLVYSKVTALKVKEKLPPIPHQYEPEE